MTKPAILLSLVSAVLLSSGCRNKDSFYSVNQDLIRVMDAHDKIKSAGVEKYVLRGRGGQLFYLEDLRAAIIKWTHLEFNANLISGVSRRLRAKGVRLLVVPVPSKVETYPELLEGRDVFDVSPSKNDFLRLLDSLKVDNLDLRPIFFRNKKTKRLFPNTDTHWDQDAIILAAEEIAMKLDSRKSTSGKAPLIDSVIFGFQGDLVEKFKSHGSDTVRLRMVPAGFDGGKGIGSPGRFKEPDSAEVLLYGDSFLNQYGKYSAHLGAHLSRESGAAVKTNHSLAGFTRGPEKIDALVEAFPGIKAVVWVFTSRTLMEAIPGE